MQNPCECNGLIIIIKILIVGCFFVHFLFSALPTPFLRGEIDFNSLEKLFSQQIQAGVYGVVLSGSTGEGHSLTKEEWTKLMQFGVKFKDKIKIVAGVGFNITKKAVEYAKLADELGADYILATTPYYNKPQQRGIFNHFFQISSVVKKTKIILYNVPGRTATDMADETIVKLAGKCKNIVALKDATGKLERVGNVMNLIKDVRDDFVLLSGEDATQIGFNAMGGRGVISVVSNVAPELCKKIQTLCENNDFAGALQYQNQLVDLSKAMFCETNPVPVKYALYKMGIFKSPECRLPLVELEKKSKEFIDKCLKNVESI